MEFLADYSKKDNILQFMVCSLLFVVGKTVYGSWSLVYGLKTVSGLLFLVYNYKANSRLTQIYSNLSFGI